MNIITAEEAKHERLERIALAILQGFAASGKIGAELERVKFTEPHETLPAAVMGVEMDWAERAVGLAQSFVAVFDDRGGLANHPYENREWP